MADIQSVVEEIQDTADLAEALELLEKRTGDPAARVVVAILKDLSDRSGFFEDLDGDIESEIVGELYQKANAALEDG
jgi:hypothetical protein